MKRPICLFLVFLVLCAVAATMDSTKINLTQFGFTAGSLYLKTGASLTNLNLTGPTTNHGKFEIDQVNGNAFVVQSNWFIVNNLGNVGVGTAVLWARFNVSDGTVNQAAGLPMLLLTATNKAITSEASLFSVQSTDDQAVDLGGSINLGGRSTTASIVGAGFANISGRKENGISGNFAGYLQFGTSDSGSDISERARLTSVGNLAIGQTTAATMLHVAQTITAANILVQTNITSTNGFTSYASDARVSISPTGWTNNLGKNAHVAFDGTAMTYILKTAAGTPWHTNAAAVGNGFVTLQSGGAIIISGTGVSGDAVPF